MAQYAKFNEGRYKALFDQMYGAGTYASGMDMAKNIGRTTAEAEFAKEAYMERLREAQAAAKRAQEEAEYYASIGGYGIENDLVSQWKQEREEANKPAIDRYYESQSEALNKGRSVARKKIEDIYPGIIKPPAQNKNLTPWERMKLMGG